MFISERIVVTSSCFHSRTIPAAVGNLLSLPMDSHGDIVKCVFTRWVSSKPSKMAKFVDYCFTKVQKLKCVANKYISVYGNGIASTVVIHCPH